LSFFLVLEWKCEGERVEKSSVVDRLAWFGCYEDAWLAWSSKAAGRVLVMGMVCIAYRIIIDKLG
jgi:hypothetical protein